MKGAGKYQTYVGFVALMWNCYFLIYMFIGIFLDVAGVFFFFILFLDQNIGSFLSVTEGLLSW